MARKKRKFDATKNRKLDEFLTNMNIEERKKDDIMAFVEKLTFEKIKEASIKKKPKPVLRLRT